MRPLIGIPCCVRQVGLHPFHIAGDKYVRAVHDAAGGLPLLVPALAGEWEIDALLGRLDGLVITGSTSNVEPQHYGDDPADHRGERDPARDATNLVLIRAAIDRGLPMLAICRGLQELNVALGGTLNRDLKSAPGRFDHHPDPKADAPTQYAPAHRAVLTRGGQLAGILGAQEITVNSIHYQGVERLADRLIIEALAPDGQVEAARVADAPGFALGVQWHPEWRYWDNPDSVKLFAAFGDAARAHAEARTTARAAE
jgi:putative glutamine amidotransferase